ETLAQLGRNFRELKARVSFLVDAPLDGVADCTGLVSERVDVHSICRALGFVDAVAGPQTDPAAGTFVKGRIQNYRMRVKLRLLVAITCVTKDRDGEVASFAELIVAVPTALTGHRAELLEHIESRADSAVVRRDQAIVAQDQGGDGY